ncbi:hypothetical protein KORDIASMS9_04325 [Kordia sp. SMS9]|uniref:hypothetical protein n=1 Tax=Kordia sp. SMS9 TaxID=2282170 RepID=UPI000E0D64BB|nr:hypothetical protein [Kordia sp. SMS9]AXG72063.1 hypothetical protein KORDIASMS9_04325 [Kordia sp. SMS9]
MLPNVDIKNELLKERANTVNEENLTAWIADIFQQVDKSRAEILQKLNDASGGNTTNQFDIDNIDSQSVFHISQIEKVCVTYRLRFLDTKYFKGEYPEEAISAITNIEKQHNTTLSGFKIIAPSKLFVLKEADDPLLFAPIGNGYYYLIHKWGNDLNFFRKFKYWPIRNEYNFLLFSVVISILGTWLTYSIFSKEPNPSYAVILFMFHFKSMIAVAIFYGVASGKNFNKYIWKSIYNKLN